MAEGDAIDYKANRSHSEYKLQQIDFDDFTYNLNKTIYNYQKSIEGKPIDKISKFRRAKSFKVVQQDNDKSIFQTFSRNAPGFTEEETKELMELILQLELLFVTYRKCYPQPCNPVMLAAYLNCLAYNKEKYFDNFNCEMSEQLQMAILLNSQQRIMNEKTDENLLKFLINEIHRRNKYKKNLQLIRNDLTKIQKLSENYELLKKTKQLETSQCNLLVSSLKLIICDVDNEEITVRFPLFDKKKILCVDLEKHLKQGDPLELFKRWSQYIDLQNSHSETTLLISIIQDLFQEDSWIIQSIISQIQGFNIKFIKQIVLQIGQLKQMCSSCEKVMNRNHSKITNLLQIRLQQCYQELQINELLKLEKHVMIMQNSYEELQKGHSRNCLEKYLLQLENIKICLIPQGLLSQLFYIHRYCDSQLEEDVESTGQNESERDLQQCSHQQQQNKQFLRQASRRTSMISFGYSEMNSQYNNNPDPLKCKLGDLKLNSTIYIDNVDKQDWKETIELIKQENKFKSKRSHSSSSSFKNNLYEEKFMRSIKTFLQNQQNRR